MRQPTDGFINANGVRLHYLDWGNRGAPVLLLLHGGSAHAHWWDFFADAMAGVYHIIALDLRGHGDSDHAHPPVYDLDAYAADVAAVATALDLPRLFIAGHSLGALVATVFASQTPLPIGALVIVDIRISGGRGGRRFMERLRHMRHPVYSSRADGVRRFTLLPRPTHASQEVLAHVAVHGLRDLPDGRSTLKFDRAALSDAVPRDVSAELQRIRCPVLYVRGAVSTVVPQAALAEVRAIAPHAETAEVPNACHHVMLDNPAGFERAVREFLERCQLSTPGKGDLRRAGGESV